MKKKKKSVVGKVIKTIISSLLTLFLIALIVAANTILPQNSILVNTLLGIRQSVDNSKAKTEGLDLNYNVSDYTKDEIGSAETKLGKQIAGEGIVLLKNDNQAMPFDKKTKFSLFSANSDANFGGLFDKETLKDSFENEGFTINETMWKFYSKGKGKKDGVGPGSISFGDTEDFSINETPLSVLKDEKDLLESAKGTTPIFVLKRVAGEGRDMPRSMYNHTDIAEDKTKSYLEPDSTELEVLKYLNDNFDNVSLIVNSNAALELDWLKDFPNISSVIYAPILGNGTNALAQIFSGKINPSGRTVDTFASDALASPAAQNFGDYQYYTEDGKKTKYNYVSYAEGIYVGYKYYETRYEDTILKQGNAGEFDYANEVIYPFGYGLSYTDFEWSNFKESWKNDDCTVTVDVTNSGEFAGKDVVEIFAQSPYTHYDKTNKIEKSSVELVGYGKTKLLKPGEKETIKVTFNKEQLKSYDAINAKTYILDAGDYYVTAAKNAHNAINNILSAKGKSKQDGMIEDGNKELVAKFNLDNSDTDITKYAKDTFSGIDITNLFDEALGDITYLTRSDWVSTFPKNDGEAASGLFYGGTGVFFPNVMVLAQSWNQELALEYGEMIGNEALLGGANGWYAPALNIHRTPFSGRNGEYYSEDGFLSGVVAAQEVYGAASKGMYTYIKHYALNDQENHRGDRDGQFGHATWSNEQAIRELYLLPFEMCMKVGDVELNYVKEKSDGTFENTTRKIRANQAVMSAFNRVGPTWTGGSYSMITGILRNEWAFNGFVITDNANTSLFMDPYQMVEAGADAKLLNQKDPTNFAFDKENIAEYHYSRKAIHRILFTTVNSKAMNGAMPGSNFKIGIQYSRIIQVGVTLVSGLLILLMSWFTYKRFKKNPKNEDVTEA